MEVDSILRKQSGGTKSIDDFAGAFFDGNDGDCGEVTYTFDDVGRRRSNSIQPYDWAGFLKKRITETRRACADYSRASAANGYKLIYAEEPTPSFKQSETTASAPTSAGARHRAQQRGGATGRDTWDSPAFKAGLTVSDTIVAVNGQA